MLNIVMYYCARVERRRSAGFKQKQTWMRMPGHPLVRGHVDVRHDINSRRIYSYSYQTVTLYICIPSPKNKP